MSKRWLRYGLVGNFLSYGIGTLFIAYTGKKIAIKDGSFTILERTIVPKWMSNWPNNSSLLLMLS